MWVGCPCPPVRNDIVTPRHLLVVRMAERLYKWVWRSEGSFVTRKSDPSEILSTTAPARPHYSPTHLLTAPAHQYYCPCSPASDYLLAVYPRKFILAFHFILNISLYTSNGGYRHEGKSCKHWQVFTKLLSSVTAIFFICWIKSRAIVWLNVLKIREK